ncbi:transcriptional regulator PpsR [Methylocystis echinoides]|jgi:transcriptional regulator PpsR|uniref:transcriptional regulator PpsR n=1 Tax=Methylocystis echinoides TaxID=29468 RepID=UPI00342D9A31
MTDKAYTRPDLTLTLDEDGVIQKVVTAESLAREPLDQWRGRRWGETIDPAIDSLTLKKIEDVRLRGDPSCFQVRQRFPSGLELPMEYTTFSLGEAGFIAIGRNLEAISELQARLQLAQEARERDYWKMREIETRYRTLFDATTEAVALVNVPDLRVVEANFRAAKDLYLSPGAPFLPQLSQRDRRALDQLLEKTREQGRAPGIVIQPTPSAGLWSLRASLMNAEASAVFICQLTPMREADNASHASGVSIASFIDRLPEGFVVIDCDGIVRAANGAFLDLVQLGAEVAAIGSKLTRWLSSPGADANVVMALIRKHGDLRRFQTRIDGELGQSTPVEITAVGDDADAPNYFGLLVRDIRHASGQPSREVADRGLSIEALDNRTLEAIVRMSTEAIERKAILAALEQCNSNRTAAARQLGLSRQGLHAKLKKYGLERK